MRFALIGNPNSGKTTLFNSLTGATARTGNWPGVTVSKKEGKYNEHTIIDLPGIYSLSPYSPEEIVSRNFLLHDDLDCVINIIDASNIERNLYLTMQLLELDLPIVLAFNMVEMANEKGITYDIESISKKLGVKGVEISALKKKGLEELIEAAKKASSESRKGFSVSKEVNSINYDIRHKSFIITNLLKGDELIINEYKEVYEQIKKNKRILFICATCIFLISCFRQGA